MKIWIYKAPILKEKIISGLNDKFTQDGFKYKKTMNEFVRSQGDFSYKFYIEQLAWSSSYSLDIQLYISQKKIETILKKIIGKWRHNITMGQDIGRIYNSPDGREIVNGSLSIWLYQNEDVEAAIESLEWYYNDIAKPYFQQYQTLEAVDDIINNPPFNHCPAYVGGNLDNRCMKGLIVARLVDNPRYNELVAIYDEAIKETMNEVSIENYYKVREYLMYNKIK